MAAAEDRGSRPGWLGTDLEAGVDIPIFVATTERRIFRGARLLRVGVPYPRSKADFYLITVGIQLPDSDRVDFFGDGFDGSETELATGTSELLTGDIGEPLEIGAVVIARVEVVGSPLPLVGTTVQAVVGWADAP